PMRAHGGITSAQEEVMGYRSMAASALAAAMLAIAATAGADAPAPGLGRWITETGNYEVAIAPCADKLCGPIVKVLGNRSTRDPRVEMVPGDPRPALDMRILTDLTPSGEREWYGYVYDRESAKTYSCRVTLAPDDQLQVRGYIGLPMFGRTAVWHRP